MREVEGHIKESSDASRKGRTITRRRFLSGAGTAIAAAGASSVVAGCGPDVTEGEITTTPAPAAGPAVVQHYPDVPFAPARPPSSGTLRFFTRHEADTVNALIARILPGTADDPGAREAGVLNFIDHVLSQDHGFAQPVYRSAPFAETYEGDEPPEEPEGEGPTVWIQEEELDRYGYQSILTPRESYRVALLALDRYARSENGADFVDLTEEQQDIVVDALARDEAEGFEEPSAQDFFEMVRTHVVEGMFSDPAYGGNLDKAGWRLIGYPGYQRSYTPQEMAVEGTDREPMSLDELPPVYPGESVGPHAINPIAGSAEWEAGDEARETHP